MEILKELRDITRMQGQLEQFGDRISQVMADYSNRPGLLRRIQKAQLHQ